MVWGLQDAVSACPAGDSVLAGHPARLRIGVHYEDAFCNARVGVPPESIWVTYSPLSGTNLKVNDQGVEVFADDSTNANGDARITIPSFSGCGRVRVNLFVSGVAQGNKLAYVRTADTDADGRVTSADATSPCDLNYNGVSGDTTDARLVQNHLDDWHRNALHGTLVRRTNLSEAEGEPGAIGESEIFWSPNGRWLSYSIHGPSDTKCRLFIVPSSPLIGDQPKQFTWQDTTDYDPSWSPLGHEIVFDRKDYRILRKGIPGLAADTTLYLVTASGDPNHPGDLIPAISPDGQWVAFSRSDGGPFHLYKVPIGGGTPTQLTFGLDGVDFYPQWSPDGLWITFDRQNGASDQPHHVYKVSASGGTPVAVYDPPPGTDAATPGFSPDGAILLFGFGTHDTGPNPPADVTTRTLDPSSASLRAIANYDEPTFAIHGPDPVLSPRLSPDGTRLALRAKQLWAVRRNMSLPPQFTSITTSEDGPLAIADSAATMAITMSEGQPNQAVVAATDPEGDALTYNAYFLQPGMSFNPATRALQWVPPLGTAGKKFYVVFHVRTPSGGTDSFVAVITIVIVPNGPQSAAARAESPAPEGPNPTTGRFGVATPLVRGVVAELSIYDLLGRRVTVVRGPAGSRLEWDGRAQSGRLAPGGVYLYHVDVAGTRQDGKLVLLR